MAELTTSQVCEWCHQVRPDPEVESLRARVAELEECKRLAAEHEGGLPDDDLYSWIKRTIYRRLELTHVWKDQSGNVVAELYGGVSLIPEIARRQERIDGLKDALESLLGIIEDPETRTMPAVVNAIKALKR